jgi:hypothetical protein
MGLLEGYFLAGQRKLIRYYIYGYKNIRTADQKYDSSSLARRMVETII